ncbi:MAG: RNA methyltransferase [Prosthecobacter sp.]|nr:RNA methyltransferase [Prosthecobacter sp.]
MPCSSRQMLITSTSNERIKHARRVREGREPQLIFVEGERLVEECLRSGLTLSACFHTPEPGERMMALLSSMKEREVPCHPTQPQILASLSDTVTTQGLIVLAQRPVHALETALQGAAPLLLGLDRVQDPGNFGTLVRTAEAAGASGIIALSGCADAYAPKTLRSAMGSAFRLPIIVGLSTDDVADACTAHHLRVVAAAGAGEMAYYDYDWRQPTLLWLGNEARGLDEPLMASADVRLRIPLQAGVESLNVAAAGAAMLFEAVRQRLP